MSRSRVDGGAAARRAVVRWSSRLVRRDWRQYTMIVVLLTVAVAASVLLTAVAYNIAPAEGRAEFGDANYALFFEDSDQVDLPAWIAAGTEVFGTIDVVGHRPVAVPGTMHTLDYRAQDVDGAFSGPLLDVRSGRAPTGGSEAAVTDGVVEMLSLALGDVIDLDGVERAVVGVVENPSDLDDEFVLLPPSELAESQDVTMLASASSTDIPRFGSEVGPLRVSGRSSVPEDVLAGVLMLLASTVLMVLVALVASASFTVIAQRRLPQLGMLAAIGATERHIRLSMLASGAVTGIVAALVGAATGLGVWIGSASMMESTVNHRIDPANIPWWLVIVSMVLAITTATAAAWWPARTMSRIPTVMALSGRTPRPARPHRSTMLAVSLLAAGVGSLFVGSDFGDRGPDALETLLLVVGILAVIAGVLLVSPVVIRGIGRIATALPISGRLALRDLSRYQARSSAALAAIGLALGIPSVIVAATAAAENASPLGNLSTTQILVRSDDFEGPFAPDAAEVEGFQSGVDRLTDLLGSPSVLRLDTLLDPTVPRDPKNNRALTVSVVRKLDDGWEHIDKVYAATPELLAELGIEPDDVDGTGVVTSDDSDLYVFGASGIASPRQGNGDRIPSPGTLPATYTSLPSALIDPDAALERGWEIVPSGHWLIETAEPLDSSQLDAAREIATRYGFLIETRDGNSDLGMIRLGAGLIGMLLALGVLSATVGLIRGESANEVRALTAAGATRSIRRGITAVTAGALAALGAALGIASAYIGLAAGRVDHLTPLPWRDLALIAVGTPLIATIGAWLLAGREPTTIARRPLD